jgi:2-polyprenyl-3-methyl-5-hydroxy-6-metoxy-1,4-benzoquinol methylase
MDDRNVTTTAPPPGADAVMSPRCPACGGELGPPTLTALDRMCGLPGIFTAAQCTSCEMGVTVPSASEAELASFYTETYGTYESLPTGVLGMISKMVQDFQSRRAMATVPLVCIAGHAQGRLLDVGCGRGDLGSGFVRRGWSVVGIDPSAQACEVAGRRGLQTRVGTLASAPLENDAYDVAVFRHSLEHVTDPLGDLRRVYQALREGGAVIISVPNFGSWQRERFGGRWFMLDLPRHRFHFNADALRRMLVQAGFQSVQTMISTSAVGLPGSIQYALAGRCLFNGIKQRVAVGLCLLALPLNRLLDGLLGEGDYLHAIGYRGR